MTNRREFLQIGISAGAWPFAARTAHAAGMQEPGAVTPSVRLYKVVYDTRFPDSVAFARRMAALGIAVQAMRGDVTRFWYDDLYHRWSKAPVAIAGLTAHGPLFVLERLAWDQRMRVVFRAEHRVAGNDCVEHRLSGPLPMLHRTPAIGASGSAWSTKMADVVAACPRGRAEIATTSFTASVPGAAFAGEESLYSWVIAPASRG